MLKFFSALLSLADALSGLAGTVKGIDGSLQQAHANLRVNLALDPPALPEPTTTPPAEEKKGRGKSAA